MAGINQLPAGSEVAAGISLIWGLSSWLCSLLLLWLTWSHHEGFSYLALLSVSALFSNTFSIVQQGRDITGYQDMVNEQFLRKQRLPGNDPELAIAGGSFGVDLVLYYLQYYSYNVQAMLVMFWAAELCQLTYQIGEHRKIRRTLRKVHAAGKVVSWLFPLVTISSLQTPSLKDQFLAFILIADLPLMLSLAIGSCLMIAVTIKYVQSRQKFTQWNPPNFNSTTSGSEAGTSSATFTGTQTSSRPVTSSSTGRAGLYDRWLMVRFTIAFVLLAIFEVTNTLFQVTALNNNIHDAKASAPDLSAGRAMQTFFLFMPGTTPGIFMFIVFGTTASSRNKIKALIKQPLNRCLSCFRPNRASPAALGAPGAHPGQITIERSLTITSASRARGSRKLDEEDIFDPNDIWMSDIPRKTDSAMSMARTTTKPLPPVPLSKFATMTRYGPRAPSPEITSPAFGGLSAVDEKDSVDGLSRTATNESLRAADDYHYMGPDHSDDSGPILPIQRPEVRFSMDVLQASRGTTSDNHQSKNFSRPRI